MQDENKSNIEGKISKEDHIEELYRLWRHPAIMKAHLTGGSVFHDELAHLMNHYTNSCLFMMLILSIILPFIIGATRFFKSETFGLIFPILLAATIFFVALLGQYFRKLYTYLLCNKETSERKWIFFIFAMIPFRYFKKYNVSEESLKDAFRKALNVKKDNYRGLFDTWKRAHLVSLTGYRFIWWWTLIVGISGAYIHAFYSNQTAQTTTTIAPKDIWEVFMSSDYGLSFMTCVGVSVFAYIATNVIHELILVRDSYRDTGKEAQSIGKKINSANGELKKLDEKIKGFYDAFNAVSSVIILGNKKNELNSFFSPDDFKSNAILRQKDALLDNIAEQAGNFLEQIKGKKIESSLCVATTINKYLESELTCLNGTKKQLVTTYGGLGSISAGIVDSLFTCIKEKGHDIEFYGMILKSPEQFLLGYADKNWIDFLKENYNAVKKGVCQKRYFFSITGKDARGHNLNKVHAISELKKIVSIDKEGRSEICPKGLISSPCEDSSDCIYSDYDCCTAGEAIYSRYHKDSAYIYELSLEDFNSIFQSNGQQQKKLTDANPMNLVLDYFAVKINGEWSFCLKSLYNEAVDYAKIHIYHNDMANQEILNEWNSLKKDLDNTFSEVGRKGVSRIDQYAV